MGRKSKFWDTVEKFKKRLMAVFTIITILSMMLVYAYSKVDYLLSYYVTSQDFNAYKKITDLKIKRLKRR